MMKWLKEKWNSFVKNHIVSDFPDEFPAFCFDCNEGSCEGCSDLDEYLKKIFPILRNY
jgi:hypothetical protein